MKVCEKCGKKLNENEKCGCEMVKKGFLKRGTSKLMGILKKIHEE